MKKLAIIFTIIIFITVTKFNTRQILVKAEPFTSEYAQIVTDDCAFYADASLKIVKIYLPKSYSVKIISVGVSCSRVAYMDDSNLYPALEGYVLNVCLNFLDEKPETVYPSLTLTTKYDEVIFGDVNATIPKTVIAEGTSVKYYGEISIEGIIYEYVYTNGFIGYMRKDCFLSFFLPENPIINNEPLLPDIGEFESSALSQTIADGEKQKFDVSEILIVAVIVVAGLILIFFLLKPGKDDKKNQTISFDD